MCVGGGVCVCNFNFVIFRLHAANPWLSFVLPRKPDASPCLRPKTCLYRPRITPRRRDDKRTYICICFAQSTQARKLEAQVAKLETAVASATTAANGKASKAEAKAAEAKAKAVEAKMKKEIEQAEAKSKVMHETSARLFSRNRLFGGAAGRLLEFSVDRSMGSRRAFLFCSVMVSLSVTWFCSLNRTSRTSEQTAVGCAGCAGIPRVVPARLFPSSSSGTSGQPSMLSERAHPRSTVCLLTVVVRSMYSTSGTRVRRRTCCQGGVHACHGGRLRSSVADVSTA